MLDNAVGNSLYCRPDRWYTIDEGSSQTLACCIVLHPLRIWLMCRRTLPRPHDVNRGMRVVIGLKKTAPDPGSVSTATVSKWRATTTMRRWGQGGAFRGVLEKKASPRHPFDHMASWEKIL